MKKIPKVFIKFLLVGAVGFFVDLATTYCLFVATEQNLIAKFIGFAVAMGATYYLNSRITFQKKISLLTLSQYAGAQVLGIVINLGTYLVITSVLGPSQTTIIVGVATGSCAALGANYLWSRRILGNQIHA